MMSLLYSGVLCVCACICGKDTNVCLVSDPNEYAFIHTATPNLLFVNGVWLLRRLNRMSSLPKCLKVSQGKVVIIYSTQ